MVKTTSNMLPLGTKAPDFKLIDTISGNALSLNELKSNKATVIMFICNHCPYVIHINDKLVELANEFIPLGANFIAISSNDIENYPADAPDKMAIIAQEQGYPFPYLFDSTQEVAKAYHAACTPDFYIFDKELQLVYRGQFDDSRPGNEILVTGHDLEMALNKVLCNIELTETQKPSLGCNIKWKT